MSENVESGREEVVVVVPEEVGEGAETEAEEMVELSEAEVAALREYRGPCRRCGLRRLEDGSGGFPQMPPHPQGEDGCVPGFWGDAADGPLFGTEGYWALLHIRQRLEAEYWERWDRWTMEQIEAAEGVVGYGGRVAASLALQKAALEKAAGGDAVMGGDGEEKVVVKVKKGLLDSSFSKYAGLSGEEQMAAYEADCKVAKEKEVARKEKEAEEDKRVEKERRERVRSGALPPPAVPAERWGFGGPASVLGPSGSLSEQPGWTRGPQRVARPAGPPAGPSSGPPLGPKRSEALPFGGMRPPSGPRGFRGGRGGGRGVRRGGFGGAPPGSVGAGPDLAKVKQELEKAKEQVEKAVREEQTRALAAHVAKRPRNASESDWLAGGSEWAPSAQLKRKMEEVEAQEQALQVSEFAASLRLKAAEKVKVEEKARAATLKLRGAEIQHFVKVREWQAGHFSPAQMIEKKTMEAVNDKYKELVKGLPFRQFSSTVAMTFGYVAAAAPGGRVIGDDERRAWTSTAFKTTLGEGLTSVLYTEEQMRPARPEMPVAVQEARLARGVTGRRRTLLSWATMIVGSVW